MTLTAFIFARGGSKGLQNKNIKRLAGKPLIAWAIEQALSVKNITRVIVSTDDPKIASVATQYGAQVPFTRPDYLASDTASEWNAWQHALDIIYRTEGALPDPFISIPATSPLRLPKDIQACLDLFNDGGTDMVVAVTEPHRNPWFNMVKTREDNTIVPVNGSSAVVRRQDTPDVFDMTTFAYVADPKYVLENNSVFSGRVKAVEVPIERSVDIDTLHDFEVAEFLMKKRMELT